MMNEKKIPAARIKGWMSERKLQIILTLMTVVYATVGISTILMTTSNGVPTGDDYTAIRTFSTTPLNWLSEAIGSVFDTSRYTQSVSASIAYGLFREKVAVILPLLTIIWLYGLTFSYLRLLLKRLRINMEHWSQHLVSATTVSVIILWGYPTEPWNVSLFYQSFFFSSAIVTYTLSVLSLGTLILIYLKKYKQICNTPKISLVLFSFILLIICLWSEPLPATILSLSFLGIVALLTMKKKNELLKYLIASLLTSLISLALMYFSPARMKRSQFLEGSLMSDNIMLSILDKMNIFLDQYMSRLDLLIVIIAATIFFAYISVSASRNKQKNIRKDLILISLCFLLSGIISLTISIALLVVGYGTDTSIITRPLSLGHVLFSTGLILTAGTTLYWIYSTIPRQNIFRSAALAIGITACLASYPSYMNRNLSIVDVTSSYRNSWIEQDLLLLRKSKTDPRSTIYLPPENAGIGDGFSLSCNSKAAKYTNWLNAALQNYYQVDSICSTEDNK